jgi:hypothetical protein
MLSSLKMTECRLDSLHNAFLNGNQQYQWDGISTFLQKMALGSSLASALKLAVEGQNFSNLANLTSYASIYIDDGVSLYNGVKDDYSSAQITLNDQNASQNIALTTLIPNLFSNYSNASSFYVLAELEAFLGKVDSAMTLYDHFELVLN